MSYRNNSKLKREKGKVRNKTLKFLIFICSFTFLLFTFPFSAFAHKHTNKPDHPKKHAAPLHDINDVYVALFILDGTPRDVMYGMIENGLVPNIKKYFWDSGAHAKAMISTFPSASAPAYQSFITGLFPGDSGIPYLEWFDRINQKEVDYLGLDYVRVNNDMWNLKTIQDPNVQGLKYPVSIFEDLAGYPTASVYSEVSRGAGDVRPTLPLAAMQDVFLTHREELLDVRAYREIMELYSRPLSKIPRFTLVGLYSVDVMEHKEGVGSKGSRDAIIQFDKFLPEFIALLKEKGIFEKTYIVVVGDHGMHNISKNVDIDPILISAGLKPKKTNLKKEVADYFLSERGVASAQLYFKGEGGGGKGGLNGRPTLARLDNYPVDGDRTVNVIEVLRESEDLKFVIARNGFDRTEVYSDKCHSTITKIGVGGIDYYGYKVGDCDPLDYCGDKAVKPMCDGRLYRDSDWLAETYDKKYPDGVVQLSQIFNDGRAGDIFLVASDDGGFYRSKMATHGSLIKDDMVVPLLVMGPGVEEGEIGVVRTIDVHSMMKKWFNIEEGAVTTGTPEQRAVANLEANGGRGWNRGVAKAVDAELVRRRAQLAKFEILEREIKKKADIYPLILEQIEKAKEGILSLRGHISGRGNPLKLIAYGRLLRRPAILRRSTGSR